MIPYRPPGARVSLNVCLLLKGIEQLSEISQRHPVYVDAAEDDDGDDHGQVQAPE